MFLRRRLEEYGAAEAVWFRQKSRSYGELLEALDRWKHRITSAGLTPGSVVAVEADFSPEAVALFLALAESSCIVVPMTASVGAHASEFREIAQVEWVIDPEIREGQAFRRTGAQAKHALYDVLRNTKRPGLVLFSSGSTGRHKAVVHDLTALLEKFEQRRPSLRTVAFLLFDHIGGVNTMLHVLSNGGSLIVPESHTPSSVCAAIAAARAQLLPTSPTFLSMLLLSEEHLAFLLRQYQR
jgi:acyl-coenzyme A synthetase/AMP-(fatty) acid ligase